MNDFTISDNAKLATVSGFGSLQTSGGDLNIGTLTSVGKNAVLTAIPTFAALTRIDGNLRVASNDKLASFSGFDALTAIGASFLISSNIALATVSGFFEAGDITGSLFIGTTGDGGRGKMEF